MIKNKTWDRKWQNTNFYKDWVNDALKFWKKLSQGRENYRVPEIHLCKEHLVKLYHIGNVRNKGINLSSDKLSHTTQPENLEVFN